MIVTELKQASEKVIVHLSDNFKTIQLGRASTGLVENMDIYVHSWGMTQKMNQVANITIMDAQTIRIEPWDKKTVSDIEKGIYDAWLWFSPLNHGEYILIKVPPLTQERRKDMSKIVSKDGEEAKIALRNNRHEALRTLKAQFEAKEISETEKGSIEKKVDEIIKEYNTIVDDMVKHKSEEIMTI